MIFFFFWQNIHFPSDAIGVGHLYCNSLFLPWVYLVSINSVYTSKVAVSCSEFYSFTSYEMWLCWLFSTCHPPHILGNILSSSPLFIFWLMIFKSSVRGIPTAAGSSCWTLLMGLTIMCMETPYTSDLCGHPPLVPFSTFHTFLLRFMKRETSGACYHLSSRLVPNFQVRNSWHYLHILV